MDGLPGISNERLIGAGASAAVYAAIRTNVGDMVAVKVLRQGLANDYQRAQFEKEVAALETLRDIPGIVGVLDSGVTPDGSPYLVMPLFESGSAQDFIDLQGPLDWRAATKMLIDASHAVHRAHERGIVHRDLKPANLLLTGSGQAFVADFGIAKIRDSDLATTPGLTPSFAPPEAFDLKFGPESDVYGLAATLCGLIIGTPPFMTGDVDEDTTSKVLFRVMSDPPPDLARHGCPLDLAQVASNAMAKNAADRPQNALTFAHQLETVLQRAVAGGVGEIPTVTPTTLLSADEIRAGATAATPQPADVAPPSAAGTTVAGSKPPASVSSLNTPAKRSTVVRNVVVVILLAAAAAAVVVLIGRRNEPVGTKPEPTAATETQTDPTMPGTTTRAATTAVQSATVPSTALPSTTRFTVDNSILVGAGTFAAVPANGFLWVPFDRDGVDSGTGSLLVVDTESDSVVTEIDLAGDVSEPLADGDLLWVPVNNGASGKVVVIDMNTFASVATIDVAGSPSTPLSHNGLMWVSVSAGFGEAGSVVAIDRFNPQVIQTIETFTEPVRPVLADGFVWVATGGDRLEVIDSTSLQIVDRIVVGDDGPFAGLGVPLVYDDFLYVPHVGNGEIFVVDARLRSVGARIGPIAAPRTPVVVGDNIWVSDADGSTSRTDAITIIDPNTQVATGTIEVGDDPNQPTVVGDVAFVTNFGTGSLMIIDIATESVVQEISVSPGPSRAVRTNGKIWIPHIDSDTIDIVEL